MRLYELMLILKAGADEEQLEASIGKISDLITNQGSEIVKIDKWGKRRLAYEINGNTDGFYVVIEFNAENDATFEVERVLRITEEVVRYLLVRKD
ncbi:MAG: 30S ribosomal protein S6 [Firmicutes bacterium]|nr:30S ribosomal protein S6 [Bacillota bacterium]